MIPAGDRSILVNGAEIGVVVEEDAAILHRTESHHGLLVVELYPKRIIGRHRDFVMGVKADELKGRLARSINNPFYVTVGNANDGVATAVAATGATKFQILLPVLLCHWGLRLAVNYGNQKSVANFLATLTNILYTLGSWMVLPIRNKAPRR